MSGTHYAWNHEGEDPNEIGTKPCECGNDYLEAREI